MKIENDIEIAKITEKLNTFFDLEKYSDSLFLDSEESIAKYGSFGFSFSNYRCVRFNSDTNATTEICNFIPEAEYYLIQLMKDRKNIFKIEKKQIPNFLEKNNIVDFVIFELRLTWLLVYDHHRKLFGLGNFIKKKIKQNTNLRFGEAKIEYVHTDKI